MSPNATIQQTSLVIETPEAGTRLTDGERNRVRSTGAVYGKGWNTGQEAYPTEICLARQSGVWEVNNGGAGVNPPGNQYFYTNTNTGIFNALVPQRTGSLNDFGFPFRQEYYDECFAVPPYALVRGGAIKVRCLGGLRNTSGAPRAFQKVIDWNANVFDHGTQTAGTANAYAPASQHVLFQTITVANPSGIPDNTVLSGGWIGVDDLVPFEWTSELRFVGRIDGAENSQYKMFARSDLWFQDNANQFAAYDENDHGHIYWMRRLDESSYVATPDPTVLNYFNVKFGCAHGGTFGTGDPMMRIEAFEVTLELGSGVRL